MFIEVKKIKDQDLVKIFSNRFESSSELWKTMRKEYKYYFNVWRNKPAWLDKIPDSKSKTRVNRAFLALESIINKVTGKPTKPNVIPANKTKEANIVAENLQDFFLDKYRTLGVKNVLKKALRHLFFSKILIIKVFWNTETDDFDIKEKDPRKIRIPKGATKESEAEFIIEEIDEPILDILDKFANEDEDLKKKILSKKGITLEQAILTNPELKYYEVWIGDGVFWTLNGMILDKVRNPFWDFDGLRMSEIEEERLSKLHGKRRRKAFDDVRDFQKDRRDEVNEDGEIVVDRSSLFNQYLFNYFDKIRKPYIFGTVLEVSGKPIGDTSLMDQIIPLQENIDSRKRQIEDNADTLNGITKIDTSLANITLADATKIHYDVKGMIYGPGVSRGVIRETGDPLPEMAFKDLDHSIQQLDEIAGTTATFRGAEGKAETATGRAILREESFSRLTELIDLVDFVTHEMYKWWFQLMKIRYTETHYIKPLGVNQAKETIELTQADLQEGIQIQIIPGQVLPEDKVFKAERAREDFKDGIVDIVTYLKAAGGYDNPEEIAKRTLLFKINPFSIIDLDEEDLVKIQDGIEISQLIASAEMPEGPVTAGGGGETDVSGELEATRARMDQFLNSPQFQGLDPARQEEIRNQLQSTFGLVDIKS